MENNRVLSIEQLDALRELTNIGASHAATALSQLLKVRVNLKVPSVEMVPFQRVHSLNGDPSTLVVAVYLKVLEECPGKALFMFDPESAQNIASFLNESPVSQDLYNDEMALSSLKEVGNILLGSFLNALSRLTKLKLNFSVPAIAVDMAGAILDAVILDGGYLEDWVFIETKFAGNKVRGTLAFLPDPGTLDNLLGALGL
ncbi:MAG TPA: chemotaxis protein CheC [Candidatus Deferrimicrobium sp.]|nr:chemotaxis protein CheC [Candidatus Deferrimicrobium sp.]